VCPCLSLLAINKSYSSFLSMYVCFESYYAFRFHYATLQPQFEPYIIYFNLVSCKGAASSK
jgi:hypothetical protein